MKRTISLLSVALCATFPLIAAENAAPAPETPAATSAPAAPAAPAKEPNVKFTGKVLSVDPVASVAKVRLASGEELLLAIDPETKLKREKQTVALADFAADTAVYGSYVVKEGKNVAKAVRIGEKPAKTK
jgi:hypothetical protein